MRRKFDKPKLSWPQKSGQPTESSRILSFCRNLKVYIQVYCDNISSSIYCFRGFDTPEDFIKYSQVKCDAIHSHPNTKVYQFELLFKKLTCCRLKAFSWGNFLIRILGDAHGDADTLACRPPPPNALLSLSAQSADEKFNNEKAKQGKHCRISKDSLPL